MTIINLKLPPFVAFAFVLGVAAIAGTLIFAVSEQPMAEPSEGPVVTRLPATADESAEDEPAGLPPGEALQGWQTYRNEEYGFEARYPGDWTIESWEITNPSNSGQSFHFKNGSNQDQSIEVSITSKYPNLPDFNTNAPFSETTIGGIKTQQEVFPNGYCDILSCSDPFIGLWVKHNESIYTMRFLNTTTVSGVYGQVLSTFRFLE